MNFSRKCMSFLLDCRKYGLSINCAHMQSWHKKFAALMLLLVLPLQGMAAVLMPLACFSTPEHAAQRIADPAAHHGADIANTHQHDAHAGTDHHQSSDDGGSGKNYNSHLCCNLFSAMPASVVTVAASDLPVLTSSISLPLALFVPEQPQRPPRT
jgi:hypothetical protein